MRGIETDEEGPEIQFYIGLMISVLYPEEDMIPDLCS